MCQWVLCFEPDSDSYWVTWGDVGRDLHGRSYGCILFVQRSSRSRSVTFLGILMSSWACNNGTHLLRADLDIWRMNFVNANPKCGRGGTEMKLELNGAQ